MNNLFEKQGAEFSKDRKYRYALWRIWDETKPLVMCIGLNPSTANEDKNDPTITKLEKIMRHNGYGGFYMMNLFPLVSADPKVLVEFYDDTQSHDTEDMENMRWLLDIKRKCKDVVFAWGGFKEAEQRAKSVIGYFKLALCLKINNNGSPKHPLYCKDDSALFPYEYELNAQEIPAGGWRSVEIPKEVSPESFNGSTSGIVIDEIGTQPFIK